MVHHLEDRKAKTIHTAFNEVKIYYRKRGFMIINLYIDGEFSPLQEMITEHIPGGPNMNLTRTNEHVPEIERIIRVVKEREICVRHSLLFNKIPRVLLVHTVFVFVKILN